MNKEKQKKRLIKGLKTITTDMLTILHTTNLSDDKKEELLDLIGSYADGKVLYEKYEIVDFAQRGYKPW